MPDEEVEETARAAAIHEVILSKLPDGYDTLVGERGITLSGGQKQRVAIARTLLKDPRILILDDSTSAVDFETEAEIRQALRRLMKGRTTFIIAHRIQSVMDADLILVLEHGRVVQRGTHDELVAAGGHLPPHLPGADPAGSGIGGGTEPCLNISNSKKKNSTPGSTGRRFAG